MKIAGKTIFWLAIIIGLFLRILMLFYNGIFDMAVYHEWGLATINNGLQQSFQGVYFPLQYQIFGFCSWISTFLNIDYFIVFKAANLIFDCGNLIMLYLILQKFAASKFYLLIYWIHPWFLNIFSLGYIDFQFTFFILCSLYFTLKNTSRNYLIAGIFLAFAFLMKPQVQIVFLSFFIYGMILYFKDRDLKVLHIFIFPVILFANYAVFFLIRTGNPFRLVKAYLNVANHMPCLNANFLNGWFPVAFFLKGKDEPIYSVSDELTLAGVSLRLIAVLIVLFLIYYFVRKLARKDLKSELNPDLYLIACFSAFIVPFLMTSAHENHLFLGTVLIIPLLAKSKNLLFNLCVHIILILQFINLYGYYRLGEITSEKIPVITYTYNIALILSFIAFFAFLIMVYHFLSNKSKLFLLLADKSSAGLLKEQNK